MPFDIRDRLDRAKDKADRRVRGVTGPARKRAAAAGAAITGFVGTLGAKAMGVPEMVMDLPDAVLSTILSLPTIVIESVTGLLSSWGLGFVVAGISIIAGRPLLAVATVAAIVIGWANPWDVDGRIKFWMRVVLIAVVAFVAAVMLGPGLLAGLWLGVVP